MTRWDDDVDVVRKTKIEQEVEPVDFENSEAAAMLKAQSAWKPIHDRLKAECDAEPDLSKRAVLAKLLMDVAMASRNPAVVGKQLAQLCKIYGHESTTVRHEDATGGLEQRLDSWLQEVKRRQLSQTTATVMVIEAKKEAVGGDL